QAIKEALFLNVGYGLIQLYDENNNQITDLGDIPENYFEKIKDGGLSLALQTTNASSSSLFADPDLTEPASKKQRTEDLPRPIHAFLDHDAWLEFVSSERLKLPGQHFHFVFHNSNPN
ncbi:hypothetical protein HK100_010753, partial [Physocladia obscura]